MRRIKDDGLASKEIVSFFKKTKIPPAKEKPESNKSQTRVKQKTITKAYKPYTNNFLPKKTSVSMTEKIEI